jgi:hypothetical protein
VDAEGARERRVVAAGRRDGPHRAALGASHRDPPGDGEGPRDHADDAAPLLPRGTILKITAWRDNPAAKKSNPDPNTWVGGGRTVDEMAHAWVNVTYRSDEDYQAEVETRKAKANTQRQQ